MSGIIRFIFVFLASSFAGSYLSSAITGSVDETNSKSWFDSVPLIVKLFFYAAVISGVYLFFKSFVKRSLKSKGL